MTSREIQIGTRLELELLNRNNEKVGDTYVSQLLERQENNCLIISAPIFEARLIFISLQTQLRLTFIHHKYGLLGFTALVIGREFRGNIAVLIVQPVNEPVKIQRRTHFRLDCMADVLVRPNETNSKADHKPAIKAFTKNISGSGLCIVTSVNIPKNSEVDIELSLADNILIIAKCIVIRNTQFEVKKSKSYEIALHFTDISQKDQDNLIRYIFEQQRMQLKKETTH